jgi:hypothetical protein
MKTLFYIALYALSLGLILVVGPRSMKRNKKISGRGGDFSE